MVKVLICHLIRFGVTLHTEVRDKNNMTPLHSACRWGNKEAVQYLVEVVKCDVGESVCKNEYHTKYIVVQ